MKTMKMKNIILSGLLAAAGVLSLASCERWLAVGSDTEATQEMLFKNYNGFYTAANGVYRLLGAQELYGRHLSYGTASVLGNNYDAAKLPVPYVPMTEGDYAHVDSKALFDQIWEKGYNTVANCNNLLVNLEGKRASFFPRGQAEIDVIRGEMIGVRAMLALDMLRLFAPAAKVDDGGKYIPYPTTFPDKQPVRLTVSDALGHIIADLTEACRLLAKNDTIDNPEAINTVFARMGDGSVGISPGGLFYSYRGTRMNYFAATALLARAYQWRNAAGDGQKAYDAARAMYRYHTDYDWFQFTPATSGSRSALEGSPENLCRKMYDDILLAACNTNMYKLYQETGRTGLGNERGKYLAYKNVTELFGLDTDDYRNRSLIETSNDTLAMASVRWLSPDPTSTSSIARGVIKYQGPLSPVIRMSEVFYIMCEYLADNDLPQAVALLNELRLARGAKAALSAGLTRDQFLRALYNDMTREFMSEGQTFYLYKRLNAPIYNGVNPLDMTGRYVLPIPYSETAYSL